MIFVPFGSSPPPHNLVTKSTGTSSEQIISEGQHIAAQAVGKAPKFTPWANNPLPIARSGDSIVVPTGRIPPEEEEGEGFSGQQNRLCLLPGLHGSPRGNDPPHSGSTQTPTSLTEMPPQPKAPCCQTPPGALSPPASPPPRVFQSLGVQGGMGWGMSNPWASKGGRKRWVSGQSPDPLPVPASPHRGIPGPKARSGTPRRGRRGFFWGVGCPWSCPC